MATGDVFAIKLHMTFAGQQCRPGFYLIEGSGSGDTNPTRGAALEVVSWLSGGHLAGFSEALSLEGVEAQDIQPATARTWFQPVFAPVAGDIADDNPPPPQDSMLIEFITAFKGGKGKFARRGRMYLPGIYSTGQISGFLIEDLQTALTAFATIIKTHWIDDGTAYQMNAVAFNPGSKPRTIREVNPMVDFTIDNVVAIQRSRRPGRGI